MPEQKVFISYRRVPDSITLADSLETALRDAHGFHVVRDSSDPEISAYKGDILQLLQAIGEAQFVVAIICDDYFYSRHCMFELVSLSQQPNFKDRIFPLVMPGTTLFEPIQRIKFLKHWETKKQELQDGIRSLSDFSHLAELNRELTNYDNYRDSLDSILKFLTWSNSLTLDKLSANQFELLATELRKAMPAPGGSPSDGKKPGLREEARYTTNRQEQWPVVSQMSKGAQRLSGFVLHGEKPQSHIGFIKRVRLELEGQALIHSKPDLKVVEHDLMFPDIAPDNREFTLGELLKQVCDQLGLNPDERAPLIQQRFGALLRDSKVAHSLRDRDVLLLLIRINFDQWESPAFLTLMDWLTAEFFDEAAMDAATPRVLLFWGLLYNSRPVVKKLTQDQLHQQLQGLKHPPLVLRELQPVRSADITLWLERHAPHLSDDGVDRVWSEWFQTPKDFDMRKVEDHLAEIIEQINLQALE